jgi:hypothetical protein
MAIHLTQADPFRWADETDVCPKSRFWELENHNLSVRLKLPA